MILAQVNIGRLVADMDAPAVAEFVGALERVNLLADRSEGFVWRLSAEGEEGHLTAVVGRYAGDPRIVVNLSTWRDYESLHAYVYKTEHGAFLRRRREWFERWPTAFAALWWVEEGRKPTVDDALRRLDLLDRYGPTARAFTARRRFGPDGRPVRPLPA